MTRRQSLGPLDPIYRVKTRYGAVATGGTPGTSPVTVTINQAPGQLDPASVEPILFDVVFSEGVTGFTTVSLTGTAGATTAVVVPVDPANYQVQVTGMTGDGTVVADVLPFACASVATGTPNEHSTSTDNVVEWVTVTCDRPRITTFTDDFNRANGPIGSNWTQYNLGFSISSNTANASGLEGVNARTVVNATFPNNQWASANLLAIGSNGGGTARCQLMLRATDTSNFYVAGLTRIAAGNVLPRIEKVVGGVNTILASSGTIVGAGIYLFSAYNNILMLCLWDGSAFVPVLDTTDSDLTSGVPGMFGVRNLGTTTMDDFNAGGF